jgi:hypothetical protein
MNYNKSNNRTFENVYNKVDFNTQQIAIILHFLYNEKGESIVIRYDLIYVGSEIGSIYGNYYL